jgi:hypothetical protein
VILETFLSQTVSYQAFSAAITGVIGLFGGVITLLWRRIDSDSRKCFLDREKDQIERAQENKEWFARVESLHRERGEQTQKVIDQVVRMTEKSEESKYATVKAMTDFTNSMMRVEKAVNDLTDKTSANSLELLKVLHEPRQ